MRIKQESGADAIGLLSSAKCTNEENYLVKKFARQVIGTQQRRPLRPALSCQTVAGLAMCYSAPAP